MATEEQMAELSKHYSESEIANLTEEEVLAILDDDDADLASLNAIVSEDDDDAGAKDAGKEAVAAAAEDPAPIAAKEDVSDEDAGRQPFVARYQADPVENYDEKMAALDSQFEDGDLAIADYNKQRDELVRTQLKSEIATEQSAQIDKQIWRRQIDDFIDEHKEYGTSRLLHAALDAAVIALGEDPANNSKPGAWYLKEAHRQVQAEFGRAAAVVDDKGAGKPVVRKPDLTLVPETLGHAPAADSGEKASEFDNIDKLDGIEYEKAVARMTEDQRTRYLAA